VAVDEVEDVDAVADEESECRTRPIPMASATAERQHLEAR